MKDCCIKCAKQRQVLLEIIEVLESKDMIGWYSYLDMKKKLGEKVPE